MRVNVKDGRCRNCQSALEIIEADDAAMTVMCLDCGESYDIETDAFGDGEVDCWPQFISQEGQT